MSAKDKGNERVNPKDTAAKKPKSSKQAKKDRKAKKASKESSKSFQA